MSARAIIHVDMDAFFAAVEVLDDPTLDGLPVLVGGAPAARGVVAAASYQARRYGIHSAMPTARALKLCPDAVLLKPRPARYAEVSERIFAVFHEYTPLVEPLSIDEAFLDVTGCRRLFGSGQDIGLAIKTRIAKELGLSASVGVAPNKFLAKLASELEKPAGFVVIAPDDIDARLAPLPVRRLWGVGEAAERKLHGLGVKTIGELRRVPAAVLEAHFGGQARHLLDLAAGRDERPVVSDREAKSIGSEVTFAADIGDSQILAAVLGDLAAKVTWRLRRQGLRGRTVTLKARYGDFTTQTRSLTLTRPTSSSAEIRDAARDLLGGRLGRRGRPLRLVGVTVSQLAREAETQGELFADPLRQREQAVDEILDRVNLRFGPRLRRGGPPAGRDKGG